MGFFTRTRNRPMRTGYLTSVSKRCTGPSAKSHGLFKRIREPERSLNTENRYAETPRTTGNTSDRQVFESRAPFQPSTQHSDAEAEAWLKRRLADEENEKSRTRFIPSVQASPTPTSNGVCKPAHKKNAEHGRPARQSVQGSIDGQEASNVLDTWASSFGKSPQERSADKARSRANANLKECAETLSQYLNEDPQNRRALKEKQEYQLIKGKADRGATLTSIECNRLKQITRNNHRRLYASSVSKELALEGPLEGRTKTENGGTSAETKDREPGVNEGSKLEHSNSVSSTPKQPPKAAPKQGSKHAANEVEHEIASPQTLTPSADEDGHIISECTEDSDVDMSDAEDVDGEDNGTEQRPCYWEYSLYRIDADNIKGCAEPVLLSTYLSKSRAEDRLREEATNMHKTLEDCTRLEVRTVFEDGGFVGQTFEFASGRTVDLRIERELIEDKEMVQKTRRSRQKLEYLPIKVYAIIESISETNMPGEGLEVADVDNFSAEDADCSTTSGIPTITQPIWKECFVVKGHANCQASRRMLEHLTAHLPDDQKFDLAITGGLDTDSRRHLRELEEGDRLYNRTMPLPRVGSNKKQREVTLRVMELLLQGPRN